jgi:hypothetical protein
MGQVPGLEARGDARGGRVTVLAWGSSSNSAPLPIALAANNVFSPNPNPYAVYVTVSGATVTAIAINNNGTSVGTSGTFLINAGIANGIRLQYASGTPVLLTAPTGLTPPTSYPWNEPAMQFYTCQQVLLVPGVTANVTGT